MASGVALGKLLIPLSRSAKSTVPKTSVDLLNTCGFVHQVGAGIYDLLPLGLRVQNKISSIVRKHLNNSECTELELSTLVNPLLWKSSGRLTDDDLNGKNQPSEFTFTENKKNLLAPTAEEQITTLVGSTSYRQLPLSLYQISRKFRNELRPRGGLLRTREFLMKDLYSFDTTPELAGESYDRVKNAYINIFTELGVPFVRAEADSGDMGGNLSHEFHYISNSGEDKLVTCPGCGYAANTEKAISRLPLCTDVKEVDGATIPADRTLSPPLLRQAKSNGSALIDWSVDPEHGVPLVEPEDGDSCAHCGTKLDINLAIEVGHTFYLGDRYTSPLKSMVTSADGKTTPISMGCYGIGVTRIIAAVAEVLMDEHGLVWPQSITPFTCVVVAKDLSMSKKVANDLANEGIETAYEDRTTQIGQAMRSAREMGVPFTIVLGKSWETEQKVEILPRNGDPPVKCSLSALSAEIKARL